MLKRFFVVLLLLACGHVQAASKFDHFRTGFPLTGAHKKVQCESCHVKGVFSGISRRCSSCHNSRRVGGKPANHVPTAEACDKCHNEDTFANARFNHDSVSGKRCSSCHNRSIASGLPANHIRTSSDCRNCHRPTRWSQTAAGSSHEGVTGNCQSCHNGSTARGKNNGHIATSDVCESCHTSFFSFAQVRMDHNEIVGIRNQCSQCHQKNNGHISITSQDCTLCHQENAWKPVTRVDHAVVSGTCASCHNTPTGHINVQNVCEDCHNSNGWTPAVVDHNRVLGSCVSCHSNSKPVNHINVENVCEDCHSPVAWKPVVRVDHTRVLGSCATCHLTDKPVNHIQVQDVCGDCHNSNAWRPAVVDHTRVIGSCSTCHANDKPTNHVQTTRECDVCHKPIAWLPATFDHLEAQGVACEGCHSGDVPRGHFTSSGKTCSDCHQQFTGWLPVTYDHLSPNYNRHGFTTCRRCHTTGGSTIQNASLLPCASCHQGRFRPGDHTRIRNPRINYTAAELKDCSGACHEYNTEADYPNNPVRRRTGEHSAGRGGW